MQKGAQAQQIVELEKQVKMLRKQRKELLLHSQKAKPQVILGKAKQAQVQAECFAPASPMIAALYPSSQVPPLYKTQ